jgi:hypothetical protein
MTRSKRIEDSYRFPGFRPLHTVQGVFGDPFARIITLVRREKKQSAAPVLSFIRQFTIGKPDVSEIFPVAIFVSTWNWRSGASIVFVVA